MSLSFQTVVQADASKTLIIQFGYENEIPQVIYIPADKFGNHPSTLLIVEDLILPEIQAKFPFVNDPTTINAESWYSNLTYQINEVLGRITEPTLSAPEDAVISSPEMYSTFDAHTYICVNDPNLEVVAIQVFGSLDQLPTITEHILFPGWFVVLSFTQQNCFRSEIKTRCEIVSSESKEKSFSVLVGGWLIRKGSMITTTRNNTEFQEKYKLKESNTDDN